jgi:hypothetical protein
VTIIRGNTAEGGTNGTTVSTGNSGGTSGTAWDLVSIPTGTLTYSNTQAQQGTLSHKFVTTTATTAEAIVRWGDALNLTAASLRFYVFLPGTNPTVATTLAQFSTNNSGTIAGSAKAVLATTGKLAIQDAAGTSLFNSTNVLPTNTWVRIELFVSPGTTTSNGTIGGGYATGTGALTEQFTSTATVNAGVGPIGRAQFGKNSGTWSTQTFYMDDMALGNTGTFIGTGAFASNVAPTGNAGSAQTNVEPYTTVTLTGTDSDSDGTVASRAWTQTAGTPTVTLTGSTTQTPTFTAPGTISGTTLTFSYQVTDNLGATSTASTTTVAVLGATERAVIANAEVPIQLRTN